MNRQFEEWKQRHYERQRKLVTPRPTLNRREVLVREAVSDLEKYQESLDREIKDLERQCSELVTAIRLLRLLRDTAA